MFVYAYGPAATVATSATPLTEVDHLRMLSSTTRAMYIQALYLTGRGAGLTAISGINARIYRYATASTAGTTVTPRPRDAGAQAMTGTIATGPTVGTTATLQLSIGCGAAGPSGWIAPNPDSMILLNANGGANGNADLESASGTASLNFEYLVELQE